MSQQIQLYQGIVVKREDRPDWHLLWLKGLKKPLAIRKSGFYGELPKLGQKVSMEAQERDFWAFGVHRTLVVDEQDAYPLEGLANFDGDRNEVVMGLILRFLGEHQQVAGEDVEDEAKKRYPGQDPRFIGHAFRTLSHRGKIHKVGYRKSSRESNHSRDQAVWELTMK